MSAHINDGNGYCENCGDPVSGECKYGAGPTHAEVEKAQRLLMGGNCRSGDNCGMTVRALAEALHFHAEEAVEARDSWWTETRGHHDGDGGCFYADWQREKERMISEAVKAATEELRAKVELKNETISEVIREVSESLRSNFQEALASVTGEIWSRRYLEERQAREKAERERDEYKTSAREYMEKRDAALAEVEAAKQAIAIREDSIQTLGEKFVEAAEERDALRKRVEELEGQRDKERRIHEWNDSKIREQVEQARREGAEEMRERAARWHDEQVRLAEERITRADAGSPIHAEPMRRLARTTANAHATWAMRIRALPIDPPKA